MECANVLKGFMGTLLLGPILSYAAVNYDGSFDSAWNGGGRIAFSNGNISPVYDVVVQSNGNLLLGGPQNPGGSAGSEWLAELTPGGQFVLTFGQSDGSGKTTLCTIAGAPFCSGSSSWRLLKTQSDGKILLLTDSQLVRISPTASALDKSGTFGGAGYVSLQNIALNNVGGKFSLPQSFVVQPDGKVLVAGSGRYTGVASQDDFAVIRLNADLSLDMTFNASTDANGATFAGGQIIAFDLGGDKFDVASHVALRSDGRIILVGTADTSLNPSIAIACLTANGATDTSCGGGTGKASFSWTAGTFQLTDDGLIAGTHATSVDRAGRVTVVATGTAVGQSTTGFVTARFNPDATVDSAFGTSGFSYAGNFGACSSGVVSNAVTIDSAGRILIAGDCGNSGANEFAAARLRGDTGAIDATFGIAGLSHGSFDSSSSGDGAYAIALEPGGRPIIAGITLSSNGSAAAGRLTYDLIFTEAFEPAPRGCLKPNCQ